MNPLYAETKSVLIDKIIKTYELDTKDVADAVELYYDAQKLRIMHANKERSEGPGELVSWFSYWLELGEDLIAKKLREWVLSEKSPEEARWAFSQVGIGPIIAAGLAAHIDVNKADTVSSLWKFAGLAPGFDRKTKGTKLPYNSRLKVLCWKLGESFVKVNGKEDATYGQLYAKFKAEEVSRNATGKYINAAVHELTSKKITDKKTKQILESGKLIDGHLHSRAKRRAVKIFLAHYWLVARQARKLLISEPYAITVLGHTGKIAAKRAEKPIAFERASVEEKTGKEKRARIPVKPNYKKRAA